MKTLIAVLICSSMALSFSAEATPCRDIGAAVVNQFVAVARYKVETPEQIDAYKDLVDSQIGACENGKRMRLRGAKSHDAALAMVLAAAKNTDDGGAKTEGGLTALALTQTSFSYGYAFGD